MRVECKEQVLKALGRKKISSSESNRISQLYLRAKNTLARTDKDWINKSEAERAEAIANKTASDLAAQIAKNNVNIARDAIIKARLEHEIFSHKKLNPMQVLMRKLAYFSDQSGIQSVEVHAKQLHSLWISRLADVFTTTQRSFGFLVDKQKTDEIVRALFNGKADDADVLQMAKGINEQLEEVRQAFNRAGGNIGKLDDYGLPTSHDQRKVALAAEQRWIDDTLPLMNRDKFVRDDGNLMNDAELKALLSEAYKTITSGGANKDLKRPTTASPIGGRSKMANRHQEARILHFKDGESWLEYQSKYGTYHEQGLHEVLNNHIQRMAGEIAMMKTFGTNPRHVFTELLNKAESEAKIDPKNAMLHGTIAMQKRRAQSIYDHLDRSTQPIDNALGNIMGGLRALMVASKLGSTTLTTMGDHASMKKIANMNGLSYTKSILPEYFAQLKQGKHTEEALSFGLGINEMTGSMLRFGDADLVSSATKSGRFNARMQMVASTVMKASGLNAVTAAAKRAFNLVHMNKLAKMTREKSWADIGQHDKQMLQGNGITEQDWNLWRDLTPSQRENGEIVLTQNDFFNAPDEVIAKFLPEDKRKSANAIIDARYDFARRYMTHIFNEEGVAIIEAGARERSLTNFGEAGTFQGELGRTLFQFKAFPMGYLMRMGSRAFAQDDISSRATFIIAIIAYQTIAGSMIVQLQNIANGKNPEPVFTPDFFFKSMLKGGGLSFLGDLMSALSDPTGRGTGDFIAGPLLSSGLNLGMLLTGMGKNVIEGKESTRAMEVANALKGNLPFQNLWYSKLIVDRLLYSKLQNMIDPDYLPKTQRRLENLGNSYWWDMAE